MGALFHSPIGIVNRDLPIRLKVETLTYYTRGRPWTRRDAMNLGDFLKRISLLRWLCCRRRLLTPKIGLRRALLQKITSRV